MLDQLKKMAMEQLMNKMASNILSPENTESAAKEGANSLISTLTEKIGGGDLSAVTSLFSNDGNATEDNGVFQALQGQLSGILQNKGMNADEAQAEASNVGASLIDSLKEKFVSEKEEDSAFDLSNIAGLIGGGKGGDLGGLMDMAKKLF